MLDESSPPGRGDPPEPTSSTIDLLPLHDGPESDDTADGLELDAHQSEEIQRIFSTTLPQYLIPIEEMTEQVLSGTCSPDVPEALLGTIRSLMSAAARMGFQQVERQLQTLASAVERLTPGAPDRDVREAVLGAMLDLKDLANSLVEGQDDTTPPAPAEESLLHALSRRDASGLSLHERLAQEGGEGMLSKLSAAGLVSVDQLLSARPSEIAAVSGLPPELVNRLLQLLRATSEIGQPPPDTLAASPVAGPDELPEESSASVLVLPTDPLRRELVQKLRDQVDAEASLEELRMRVHQLRSSIVMQRRDIGAGEESCRALEAALRRGNDQLRALQELLVPLRAERASLCRAAEQASEQLRLNEERLLDLRQERQRALEEDSRMGREVQSLVNRVGGLLRQVAQGLPSAPRADERRGGGE